MAAKILSTQDPGVKAGNGSSLFALPAVVSACELRKSRLFSLQPLIVSCRTVNSTAYTFTYGQLIDEFHTNEEVATVGLTTFVLGLGLGPMLLAPLVRFPLERSLLDLVLMVVRASSTAGNQSI